MTDRNGNLNENSRSGSREDGREPVRRNTAMNSREIMLEDEDYLDEPDEGYLDDDYFGGNVRKASDPRPISGRSQKKGENEIIISHTFHVRLPAPFPPSQEKTILSSVENTSSLPQFQPALKALPSAVPAP